MVDRGANPGAHVMICKRDNTSVDAPEDNMDLSNLPEAVRKAVEAEIAKVTKQAEDAKAELAKVVKANTAIPAPVEPVVEIPEAIQKKLDIQLAEVVALRQELETRKESEAIAKAKADYSRLPDIDNVAKALYQVQKSDKALAASLEVVLKAANAVLAKTTKMTEEVGTSTDSDITAQATAVSKAKEMMKSDSKLTLEAALTKVYKSDAALYVQEENDRKARARAR